MNFSKDMDLRFFQYVKLIRFWLVIGRHRTTIRFCDPPPSIDGSKPPLMIFTAADSGYLQRFIRPFCRSAAAHIQTPRIHIHLYNPGLDDFSLLEGLRTELPQLALSWSHETFSPEDRERRSPSSNRQSWKSLYICTSRFMAAAATQEKYGLPILITDIDVLFNGDVNRRFGDETDVALFLRPEERNLCKKALGGMVYVSTAPVGRQFIARVAKDISKFLAAGFYWFAFDQLALYRAIRAMPQETRRTRVSQLTKSDMSLDLDPDGLILVPKGRAKHEGSFAAISARYAQNKQESPNAAENVD